MNISLFFSILLDPNATECNLVSSINLKWVTIPLWGQTKTRPWGQTKTKAPICGRNQRNAALLRAHDQSGDLLDAPDATSPMTCRSITEKAGTQIGPYKLLKPIGQGGMGAVYLAEQAEPVRRQVALKIIKPGMDTQQVIKRFEAERQALAMMDHPNIAKVFDAGATETGRP